MTTTEVHIPISLNETFAVMGCVLVRSIAANAELPGDWKVVFTCSRDSTLLPSSPLFAWADEYPVEFRWVDPSLWDRFGYHGTGLQQHLYAFEADVVLIMDADTIVVGSLAEVVRRAASIDTIAAWPAWQPPPGLDWARFFAGRGLAYPSRGIVYSGYALSFMLPKEGPPYFNYGFVAASRRRIEAIATTFEADMDYVWRTSNKSWFSSQIALTLNIVRHDHDFTALDLIYNCSNGDYDEPELVNAEADATWAKCLATLPDTRVLHYCVPTPEFTKGIDMGGWERLRAFLDRDVRGEGSVRLQTALKALT